MELTIWRIASAMAVRQVRNSNALRQTVGCVQHAPKTSAQAPVQQRGIITLPSPSPPSCLATPKQASDESRGSVELSSACKHEIDRMRAHKPPEHWINNEALPEGAEELCSGWLLKQHQRQPGKWAKRWFSIDDRKGRVSYAHAKGSRKVSASMPLQETSVASSEMGNRDNCFVISCSPLRLVLSARSEAERDRWIRNLQLRISFWKAKVATEGPRVAQVLDLEVVSNDSGSNSSSSNESYDSGNYLSEEVATGGRR